MPTIQRSALVPFSCQQMFDLINDIPAYPKFMPGCTGAEVLEEGDNWRLARLDLSGAGLKQSITTRNTLDPPHAMRLHLEQGPFSEFNGEWRFNALDDSACKVSLSLRFRFSNRLLAMAAGKLFERVAAGQVDAICRRAREVYA